MQIEGLKGRTAIVTAAGQNLGRAIALAFAQAGANVVVNGRNDRAKLEQVACEAEALGVRALPVLADAADWPAVQAMTARAIEVFGQVDIAVAADFPADALQAMNGPGVTVSGVNGRRSLVCAASRKIEVLRHVSSLPQVVDIVVTEPTLDQIYAHFLGSKDAEL